MNEETIWGRVNDAWERMSLPQRRLWAAIRIQPVLWQNTAYDEASVWVVATIGAKAIWYNPLESGFDVSSYRDWGTIGVTSGNQLDLEQAVQHLLNEINTGERTLPRLSGPIHGEYDLNS